MNDLSMKLRDAIAEESGRADRLYQQAFEDHLTGALNRRGLIQRVQSLLSEGTEISSGALAFVSMTGLEEVNRSLGAARGDELVQQLGEVVRQPSAGDPPIVGRWQGASFAILLPNMGTLTRSIPRGLTLSGRRARLLPKRPSAATAHALCAR